MKFNIGDKVAVRNLQDLINTYGRDSDGDIPCAGTFTKAMYPLAGKILTISQKDSSSKRYRATETTYILSDDMLETPTKYNDIMGMGLDRLVAELSIQFDEPQYNIRKWLTGPINAMYQSAKPQVNTCETAKSVVSTPKKKKLTKEVSTKETTPIDLNSLLYNTEEKDPFSFSEILKSQPFNDFSTNSYFN